eukprot:TRINITY_DN27035_c0_g1_i1.p1 TRINITY_DN27035_c0_g1~~TRINITY_DN27035_c0_g1_i1.p1  ORF type:complete len:627 (+),score=184.16 TRINITY_DN27035_c0_g1_i1:124-2004(+)
MAPKKDWSHPEGLALSELDIKAEYTGTVTNVGQYGVFVNFGAVKDGLLRVPTKIGRGLRRGMEVPGLTVVECDAENGKIVLQVDESNLPEPAPRKRPASQGAAKRGSAQGSAAKRASSERPGRPRKEWGHDGAKPLEELNVGDVFDGTVTNVSPAGVFVDIGAVKDGRLSVKTKIGRRFSIGDVVKDCKLEELDLENSRIKLVLDDPEEAVKDLPPKERAAPKPKARAASRSKSPATQGRAGAKSKAQAAGKPALKPRPRAPMPEETMAVEDLKVGSSIDGVVTNRNQYGVFVNIGCGKDARLAVPKKVGVKLRKGDAVSGMIIEEVDVESKLIKVSHEDPESLVPEDEEEEELPPPPPKPKAKAKAASASGAAGKAAAAKPKARSASSGPALRKAGKSIAKYKVGQVANGLVTSTMTNSVSVDIGAEVDATLKVPKAIAKQMQRGDEIHGMIVEAVNVDKMRIDLSLEEPELEGPEEPAAPKAKSKASPKPKPKAKPEAKKQAKARASSAPPERKTALDKWGHSEGIALKDLQVGEEVTGRVTNCGNYGVFIDFGCVKDGKLMVSPQDAKKFRKGDTIEGMVIDEVDIEGSKVALKLTYELPDSPDVDDPSSTDGKPRPKPKAKR